MQLFFIYQLIDCCILSDSLVPATSVTDLNNVPYDTNPGYGAISSIIEYVDNTVWDPNTYLVQYHLLFAFAGDRPISYVRIVVSDPVHQPTSYTMYDSVGGTQVGNTNSISLSTTITVTHRSYTSLYLVIGGPSSNYQAIIQKIYFYQSWYEFTIFELWWKSFIYSEDSARIRRGFGRVPLQFLPCTMSFLPFHVLCSVLVSLMLSTSLITFIVHIFILSLNDSSYCSSSLVIWFSFTFSFCINYLSGWHDY